MQDCCRVEVMCHTWCGRIHATHRCPLYHEFHSNRCMLRSGMVREPHEDTTGT